ncbi:MAG: CsgG/HfaB family protein [Spirochaetota bacterium]
MQNKILHAIIVLFIYGIIFNLMSDAFADSNEEKALDEVAQALLLKSDILKDKPIGMFRFTSLDGKESPDGARISQCLLERLMNQSSLKFIDRSELAKIVGEQELQQSGLVDTELVNEKPKILPIDYMITGTLAHISKKGHISARILNAGTGEILTAKSSEYIADSAVTANDSPEAVAIYKKSPDELDRINRVFFNLQQMSKKRPVVFLIAVLSDKEIEQLESDKPRLAKAIKKRRTDIRWDKPGVQTKIDHLKNGLAAMKTSYPSRYDQIMQRKIEVIAHLPKKNN